LPPPTLAFSTGNGGSCIAWARTAGVQASHSSVRTVFGVENKTPEGEEVSLSTLFHTAMDEPWIWSATAETKSTATIASTRRTRTSIWFTPAMVARKLSRLRNDKRAGSAGCGRGSTSASAGMLSIASLRARLVPGRDGVPG
jgi:hypothetical protein